MSRRSEVLEEFFIDLQSSLSKLIQGSWRGVELDRLEVVAAVDVAYANDLASAAAVSWSLKEDKPIEERQLLCEATYPYVPGLLFLREAPIMLRAVKLLSSSWQLLLVDGHGLLHPRKMGLAVFLGLALNRPTLGIAKSLLVGSEKPGGWFGEVEVSGEVLGYWFKPEKGRRFYASPGYMIEVKQVPKIIELLGGRYPKPLSLADKLSRDQLR
ncbi:MAG TPA: hypothetical protein ENF79_05580 [Nitrososphaeria archaeon]|nr:hypothetical protein [Nitrososphaeria archaeon]